MTPSEHYKSNNEARTRARQALAPRAITSGRSRFDGLMAVLRVALPGAAAVLALTMVALPFFSDNEASFTLSKEEVTEGDGRIRMKELVYRGTDSRNRLFTVRAEEGEQQDPTDAVVSLTGITADMALDPDRPLKVTAESGIYRIRNESMDLVQVTLYSGEDYRLSMRTAQVDLKSQMAEGETDVRGETTLGTITSERIEIDVKARKAVFTGRVNMRVVPKRTQPKPAQSTPAEPSPEAASGAR